MVSDIRIQPDTLADDPERERDMLLQDIKYAVSKSYVGKAQGDTFALPPEAWLREKRGTLLFCRSRETALRIRKRTLLPLELEGVSDPRAYSCVALYACANTVSSNYRRIFLCDGSAFVSEEAIFRERCPEAEIQSGTEKMAAGMMKAILPGKDPDEALQNLRKLYRILRTGETEDRDRISQMLALSGIQLETALNILLEMGVVYHDPECRIPRLTGKKKADVDFAHTRWRRLLYPDSDTD